MTPTEARHIDRLEFEADAAAARRRAHAHVRQCRHVNRQKVDAWLRGEQPAMPSRQAIVRTILAQQGRSDTPKGRPPQFLEHDGLSLTLIEWAERTGLTTSTIRSRIAYGWPADRILTTPALQTGKATHRKAKP